MKTFIVNKIPRIIKARKKLEKELEVKITNRGKEVSIRGTPENEFIAGKAIEAIEFGFSIPKVLLLKKDHMFEIINIKKYTRKKGMERIKARIIGKNGKTLRTLSNLTKCHFELKDNKVGIIGHLELIENAQEAIIRLIRGSKQINVYSYLEQHQVKPIVDLGLKKDVKKKKT